MKRELTQPVYIYTNLLSPFSQIDRVVPIIKAERSPKHPFLINPLISENSDGAVPECLRNLVLCVFEK